MNIPAGLIRDMRLPSEVAAFTELEAASRLRSPTRPACLQAFPWNFGELAAGTPLDIAVRMQAPARADRARSANWIERTCQMGGQLDTFPRVLALALAAHLPSEPGVPAAAEHEVLARLCGPSPRELIPLLDLLVATRFLRSWVRGSVPEDPHGEFTPAGPPH